MLPWIPKGDLYISDGYGNCRVHKFSAGGGAGILLGNTWKSQRRGSFTFLMVSGCTLMGAYWWPTGKTTGFKSSLQKASSCPNGLIWPRPCDFYIDSDEVVFVAELDGFMSVFNIEGELLSRWSGPTDAGAHAIWVDSRGDLYINQNLEGQRLLKYRRCV